MTQLDLPQISLSRYVDLLKRRRWQVIPVSLLGLLIGGLVAFFIPRYYVVSAGIAYQQPPGERDERSLDPFGTIIDTAKLTLPRAIPETIKALGWPEGLTEDPYELGENVRAIEENLFVNEFGNNKNRSFALIRVSYKDRDGVRAAGFLNKLVATWIAQRQSELMTGARRKLAAAKAEHKQHSQAYETFLLERQHLQRTYRIKPDIDLAVQRERHNREQDKLEQLKKDLVEQQRVVARLNAQLETARLALAAMPARVLADLSAMQKQAAGTPQGTAILKEIAYWTLAKENLNPGHPQQAKCERQIVYLTKKLAELIEAPEVDADGMIPNQAREVQRALIAKLEADLKLAEAEVAPLRQLIEREGESLMRQAQGYTQYESVLVQLEAAKANTEAADQRVRSASETVGKLTNEPSIRPEGRATVPPAPTDPNLILVALLGCVIGLFVATALVLLLDVIQGSFKTVEDVESGLSVPVLGGVSHLETEFQRRQSVRSRRRATLVAAAFLTLVGGVVLLYYFDPTRLPPFVRDMLSMVLGTA